ncbi:UNVERIFIED_CONTAM: hypothetical protein FKN15_065936 [Acipenser sinensis]
MGLNWFMRTSSLTASEILEVQCLVPLPDNVESDTISFVMKPSISEDLNDLVKRATAPLALTGSRLLRDNARIPRYCQTCSPPGDTWQTTPAVSLIIENLYGVHNGEKMGFAHFTLVEASIASLVQVSNLALLSKDVSCPNKQCCVTKVLLKKS